MHSLPVIIYFDVFKNTHCRFLPSVIILLRVDEFGFHGLEERLHRRIISAVTLSAHTITSLMLGIEFTAAFAKLLVLTFALRDATVAPVGNTLHGRIRAHRIAVLPNTTHDDRK